MPELAGKFTLQIGGASVELFTAREPLLAHALTQLERKQLPLDSPRLRDWLTGRAALRLAVGGADTGGLHFPNAGLSLTHSGGIAVAARSNESCGLGVDLELRPSLPPKATRFFRRDDDADLDPLHTWCIKEAVFKADLDNAGRSLLDYRIEETGGIASTPSGAQVYYAVMNIRGGLLAVAAGRGRHA